MATIKPRATNIVPRHIAQGQEFPRPIRGRTYNADAKFGFEFYNGLGTPVTVSLRTGVRFVIPHVPGGPTHGFLIRNRYDASGQDVKVDVHELLNDQGRNTSPEANLLLNSPLLTAEQSGKRHTAMDYTLSLEEFENNGGSIYLTNLDISLSILNPAYASPHPYSTVGGRNELLLRDIEEMDRGILYRIRIIDRGGVFGDRFVNLNGEVYHVRHERDANLKDGVYALGHAPATGEFAMGGPRTDFFTFEEADKALRLYRTYLDAKTLGDPDSQYKREVDEQKHSNTMRELELRAEKLELDQQHANRMRELEREREEAKSRLLQKENELKDREFILQQLEQAFKIREKELAREHLYLKDLYETRGNNRKESLEWLKYGSALITGLGALYAVYKKVTS